MKKMLTFLLAVVFAMIAPLPVQALTGYEAGITDTREYKEVVVLSGQPQVYTGTVKETSKTKDNLIQTTLVYKLQGQSKSDTINRTVKLESQVTANGRQEVHLTRITGLTETLQVGGQKLKLKKDGYFFSASRVIDHRPIIDYTTENWNFKKTFEIGKNEGCLIVETSGSSDGYANAWGSGNTATIITRWAGFDGSDFLLWEATVETVLNDNLNRDLRYIPSQPQLISFAGGFLDERYREESLAIKYDLPLFKESDGTFDNDLRNKETMTLSLASPPTQKRLFIKEFRDIRLHWAQQPVEAMCGLGVFDNQGNFFGPGYRARREDLARGLSVIGELVKEEVKKGRTRNTAPEGPSVFLDVQANNPNWKHIEEVNRRGIMVGPNQLLFEPYKEVTRAEVATALVNALGLTRLASSQDYRTSFYDDGDIPYWARESINVAHEIGLIKGDRGFFRPLDIMTRAELASVLDNFRVYLNRDFKHDYREGVYSFRTGG